MDADLLAGAIDTHVHSAPDVIERRHDDLGLVEEARRAGMGGLLLKSHVFSTCERAYLLNRLFPGIRVFGGLVLNDTVGGFNLRAVEAALALGAAQIWMPTKSAANHREHLGGEGTLRACEGGGVRAEVKEILRRIAASGASVATGHLSPEESAAVAGEALALGVRRVVVTHPEWGVTAMKVDVQRRLAASGRVYFDRCLVSTSDDLPERVPFETIVEQARAVGAATTILATDYGKPQYPSPVEGLGTFIGRMLEAGFGRAEVRRMVRENPADLLRLEGGGG